MRGLCPPFLQKVLRYFLETSNPPARRSTVHCSRVYVVLANPPFNTSGNMMPRLGIVGFAHQESGFSFLNSVFSKNGLQL